jgi:hypothetical protein
LNSKSLDLAIILDFGKPPVERKRTGRSALMLPDQHRRADRNLRRSLAGDRLADAGLQTHHRLFQHLLIKSGSRLA